MRKVTPSLAARIRAARASGKTIAAIAAKFKLSVGTISAVVNAATEPAPAADPPAPAAPGAATSTETPAAPPSHDDLRRWLGEQLTALRADVERYRKAGNAPALAAANRNLHAAAALLQRVTPTTADGIPEGYMLVRIDEFKAEGKRAEEKLLNTFRAMFPPGELEPTPAPPAPTPAPAPPAPTPAPRPGTRESWRDGSHVAGTPIHENPAMARRRDGI